MWPGAEMSERFSLVDTSSKTPISQRSFVIELEIAHLTLLAPQRFDWCK